MLTTVVMRSAQPLRIGPRFLYPAKAAVTRGRSLRWRFHLGSSSPDPGLRILFYHRIAEDRDELALAPTRFREQMEFLERHGYRAAAVGEALSMLHADRLPEHTVGLSFDDAYLDVMENALPELRARGFGATVFVATGVVDGSARFDWYDRQPPVLEWKEITQLDRAGTFQFEAHTVSHPNLLSLDDAHARQEIEGSKRMLEERLGRPVEGFCYPAGLFGPRDEKLVKAAGFRYATSCEPGTNRRGTNVFALKRIQIDRRDSLLDFRAKLAGGHDRPLPFRGFYRSRRYRPF